MGGLVVAGERSGVGKTTVTMAILAALRQQRAMVQSFKVGPDYIDPMFHRAITGHHCYNLDPVLTSEAYVRQSFCDRSASADYALVEGVMGLFDGATGTDDTASTAHIARLLGLPVLLVIDCGRLSRSAAAIVHGYRSFDPRLQIAGVVLNRVGSDRHLALLQAALAPLKVPILGVIRRQDAITIPDRHLGLVPTAELPELQRILDQLAEIGKTCLDWSQLEPLLRIQTPAPARREQTQTVAAVNSSEFQPTDRFRTARIAVAQDLAFSFYYPDALEMLTDMGAELLFWSPLKDSALPENMQGLWLGGGFPEVFAADLAANTPMLQQVQAAIRAGMPTYAECGGLMYLCQHLIDFEGQVWPMVGALPTDVTMGKRLTLGYRRATALRTGPVLHPGQQVWGHEFHRSQLTQLPQSPLLQLQRVDAVKAHAQEGWQTHQVHASYVHLHWGGCPEAAQQFLFNCQRFNAAKPS